MKMVFHKLIFHMLFRSGSFCAVCFYGIVMFQGVISAHGVIGSVFHFIGSKLSSVKSSGFVAAT